MVDGRLLKSINLVLPCLLLTLHVHLQSTIHGWFLDIVYRVQLEVHADKNLRNQPPDQGKSDFLVGHNNSVQNILR